MAPTSSADVRILTSGPIKTVLHMEPVMRSLMAHAHVSTVSHPTGNTASQGQVIKTLNAYCVLI